MQDDFDDSNATTTKPEDSVHQLDLCEIFAAGRAFEPNGLLKHPFHIVIQWIA
jgi:hypothetical protein